MNVIEVKNSFIPRMFGADAITLYPFIFYSEKVPDLSIQFHEWVHIRQIIDLGVLKFYFLYVKYYCELRLRGKTHFFAYLEIPFEVEAFQLENNFKKLDPSDQYYEMNEVRYNLMIARRKNG